MAPFAGNALSSVESLVPYDNPTAYARSENNAKYGLGTACRASSRASASAKQLASFEVTTCITGSALCKSLTKADRSG